jgi:hypothetical protein
VHLHLDRPPTAATKEAITAETVARISVFFQLSPRHVPLGRAFSRQTPTAPAGSADCGGGNRTRVRRSTGYVTNRGT